MATFSRDVLTTVRPQSTVTATVTLTEADCGKDYNVATDALVITLPLIEEDNIGVEFLFRNTGANGNNIITLSPNALDSINGRISTAAAEPGLLATTEKRDAASSLVVSSTSSPERKVRSKLRMALRLVQPTRVVSASSKGLPFMAQLAGVMLKRRPAARLCSTAKPTYQSTRVRNTGASGTSPRSRTEMP